MAFLDSQILVRPRLAARTLALADVLVIGLGLVAGLGLLRTVVAIGVPHPYGNEGWNAYHAAAAIAGQNPYPAADSLLTNNYPPLSFYVVGALGSMLGDILLAGRLVSLLSFLFIAAALARLVRLGGGSERDSAFAAFVFAGWLLFDSDYVGVNDPQLFGQALQIAGLVALLRRRRLAVAAALMTAGFFTKHNLIALPLATAGWLFWTDRKAGLKFAGCGLAFGLVGLVSFEVVAQRSWWQVLSVPRVWSLGFAANGFFGRLPELALPLIASAVLWRRHPDSMVRLATLYAGVSLGLAFWFLGGAGCSGNVVFDALIALSLCAGLAASRFTAHRREAAMAAWFIALAGMLALHAATDSFKPRYWLSPQAPAVIDPAHDVVFLKAHPGAVLAKDLALTWWAGKPASVDLWGYEEAVATGARDGHELIAAIAAHRFAVLQLGDPPSALDPTPETPTAYAKAVNAAIVAHYRIDHRDAAGTFWLPKSSP